MLNTQPTRPSRASSTKAERHLWRHLRARRLAGCFFRRQYAIGPAYIVDFVCLTHRLVIEVDGASHESKYEYDKVRTSYLKNKGYRVLRFTNHRVLLETTAVLHAIHRHLHSQLPRKSSRVARKKNQPSQA